MGDRVRGAAHSSSALPGNTSLALVVRLSPALLAILPCRLASTACRLAFRLPGTLASLIAGKQNLGPNEPPGQGKDYKPQPRCTPEHDTAAHCDNQGKRRRPQSHP